MTGEEDCEIWRHQSRLVAQLTASSILINDVIMEVYDTGKGWPRYVVSIVLNMLFLD